MSVNNSFFFISDVVNTIGCIIFNSKCLQHSQGGFTVWQEGKKNGRDVERTKKKNVTPGHKAVENNAPSRLKFCNSVTSLCLVV